MVDEYTRKQDAADAIKKRFGCNAVFSIIAESVIDELKPADVVPYSIDPDGTLTVTVPKGTKRISRILIEEDGTRYGGLFYPDTGGCFLSSMEGE